jgi:hypothetical protein
MATLTGILAHLIFGSRFFSVRLLKAKVYKTCPTNIPDLEQHIWEYTEAIPNDFLPARMQEWTDDDGGQLQNVSQVLMITVNFPLNCQCIYITANTFHLSVQ